MTNDDYDGITKILIALPKRIEDEMKRRGLSYRDVAAEINQVSHTAVYKFVRGISEPRLFTIVDLISWLQISAHKKGIES